MAPSNDEGSSGSRPNEPPPDGPGHQSEDPTDLRPFQEQTRPGDMATRVPEGTTWPTVPPPRPSRSAPARIGRYVVEAEVGAGGMGRVYRAFDSQLERMVAVKVVRAALVTKTATERFLGESRTLAKFEHPGIARVYDCGMEQLRPAEEPKPFFVMEYIAGASGLDRFADLHLLDVADRLRLFVKVCDAAHAAHEHGIIHRDLKPSNIIVGDCADPRQAQPKIIDFGVASPVMQQGAPVPGLAGTLAYMSPEQCACEHLDARSDVYALGVVLYELLSRRLPYSLPDAGDVTRESTRVIRTVPHRPLGLVNPTLRGDIEAVVSKALAKLPGERYQSARALGEDLERILRGEPVEARSRSRVYRVSKKTVAAGRRHHWAARTLAAGAAWVFAGLVGVPLVYDWTATDTAYWRALSRTPGVARLGESPARGRLVMLADPDELERVAGRLGISAEARQVAEFTPPEESIGDGQLADAEGMKRTALSRGVLARVVERLAGAGASVIQIDQYFVDRLPADVDAAAWATARTEATARLAEAVTGAKRRGVAVVSALKGWDRSIAPGASAPAALSEVMPFGGIGASFPPGHCELELFAHPEGSSPVLSLALQAYARRDGGTDIDPGVIPETEHRALLTFKQATVAGVGVPRDVRKAEPLRVTGREVRKAVDGSIEVPGLRGGDRVAVLKCELPPDDYFERATTTAEELLTMDDREVQRRFAGKLITIGRRGGDIKETEDGRRVPGCWANAVALESLAANATLFAPSEVESSLIIGLGCVLGVAMGSRRLTSRGRVIFAGVLVIGAIVTSLAAYRFAGYLVNPAPPLIGAIVAGLMGWMLGRVQLRTQGFAASGAAESWQPT
ncbi:MAG: protein kinase [Planctomycetes bacterium]|nr:protein kinase [Planctomycetota bacterium]